MAAPPDLIAQPAAAAAAPAIDPAQAQHVGRRDSQQDAFGFSNLADAAFAAHGGCLAVLADGMGGMRNGLWAASQAVQTYIESYHAKTADEPVPAALQRCLAAAGAVVHGEAVRLDAVDRMGTTLAVAAIRGLELHWLNVGDSRIYLVEGTHLMRLSTDHSFDSVLRRRVHRGELSAGEAMGHPLRHALTSYLGRPLPLQHAASKAAVQLRPGAWVLLCSDGLTQALDDAQIAAELHGNAQEACDGLLRAALARGLDDQDNITAVVLHVPPPGGAPEAGSISRAIYDAPRRAEPARQAAAAAKSVKTALRPRWHEPLWWAGAAAAVLALVLVALAWRFGQPAGSPSPQPAARSAPSVDLLAPPSTAASGPLR